MEPTAGLDQDTLVSRHFTSPDVDPFDMVEWERRDARAGDFFQPNVEVPTHWNDASIGVVAKLYFATVDGVREDSVRQMVDRVVSKITVEGIQQGHFGNDKSGYGSLIGDTPALALGQLRALDARDPAVIFYDELVYICLHQYAGFNTPTWLNIGVPGRKQCGHACYPLSVIDEMTSDDSNGRSITDWWRTEAKIFKAGGGSGINVSNIRGSMEELSTGGIASGPLPYMRASNAGAETLKSGGAHRRAAKFVCINDDHPDVVDFIQCKVREDEHMRILAEGGINMQPFTAEGERNIAETTSFQSANHSVCVTDEFMRRATGDKAHPRDWLLLARVTGEIIDKVDAPDLLRLIAETAWKCADPGLIFIDTINAWHTTPSLGPVTTTNTCGEVTQNDDTACNLSALNVLKFVDLDVGFDFRGFEHVVDVMATAMDIVCGFSELPTELITQNTRDLRQLGMGFTNLGAAIMAQGLPYDSDAGRDFAASITALLTGRVYRQSAKMAEKLGTFTHFEANRGAMMSVIKEHRQHLEPDGAGSIWSAADTNWISAWEGGQEHGFRNALATAMMPTGTVSFLLGADSTGIEPVLALTQEKSLAGAGKMILVNRSAKLGADALGGYSEDNLKAMGEGDFSMVPPEDKATFATALGSNSISPMGHVRMVAAIQPFVSQAISKTTNVPNEATVEDILEVYVEAWRMGVKVLSVYRDGSKSTQVLKAIEKPKEIVLEAYPTVDGKPLAIEYDADSSATTPPAEPVRRRLPRTRQSVTHKIAVRSADGVTREGYVMVGKYADGSPGEMFLEGFGKFGGFVQNALSAWATAVSIEFQYGVSLETIVRKHAYVSDETGGIVVPDLEHPPVLRECRSIIDYIARWLVSEFGDVDLCEELGVLTQEVKDRKAEALQSPPPSWLEDKIEIKLNLNGNGNANSNGHHAEQISGPPCGRCGSTMYRAGACWQCSCGEHTGCG